MKDSKWHTLREIADKSGESEASISARIRDFRKAKYGSHQVNSQRRSNKTKGWFEYQLVPSV